jgi:hypothetical protein
VLDPHLLLFFLKGDCLQLLFELQCFLSLALEVEDELLLVQHLEVAVQVFQLDLTDLELVMGLHQVERLFLLKKTLEERFVLFESRTCLF